MVKVVLCICTYKRPQGLTKLLREVAKLEYEESLHIVVVDNDPEKHGQVAYQRFEHNYRWPLIYANEPRKGISFARNRAVLLALEHNPTHIAMLDDDEWPTSGWLKELLRVQSKRGCDIVGGPHLPIFSYPDKLMLQLSSYYGMDQRLPEGADCLLFSSGNFLANVACFEALCPTPFAPAFAQSGGEDLVFFYSLSNMGYRMAWAPKAIVFEEIPPERMNLTWLRRRQVRRGNINVTVQRMFRPGILNEATRLLKTVALFATATVFLSVAWPHRPYRIRATLLLYKAKGKFMSHAGYRFLEYV